MNWTVFPRPQCDCKGNCNKQNWVVYTKHMDEDLRNE
jgi:hypothetical protein